MASIFSNLTRHSSPREETKMMVLAMEEPVTDMSQVAAWADGFASLDTGTCDWEDSLVNLDAIRKERGLI
jgi:hypothetical protein